MNFEKRFKQYKTIEETIDFITAYSKYHKPTIGIGVNVCFGMACDMCKLNDCCTRDCAAIQIEQIEAINNHFPEYNI